MEVDILHKDDDTIVWYFQQANGTILYFLGDTTQLKSFMDRWSVELFFHFSAIRRKLFGNAETRKCFFETY